MYISILVCRLEYHAYAYLKAADTELLNTLTFTVNGVRVESYQEICILLGYV